MRPCGVIFDRDGTLVFDVAYNGDPAAVRVIPGVKDALDRLRAAGIPVAVVSNQSGVARGMITARDVERVNAHIEQLIGPFAAWAYCPHGPDDDCACRKPKPQMIFDAARAMKVDPGCCVVVGDKASDVEAARNAGAHSIFIDDPNRVVDAIDAILHQL